MKLFSLLHVLDPYLSPKRTKLHLATPSGKDDPLAVFLAGDFPPPWQEGQTQKNFELDHVVALIALREPECWIFGGAFDRKGLRETSAQPKYRNFKS